MCEAVSFSTALAENFIPDDKIGIIIVRQNNSFVRDFVIFLAQKRNFSTSQFNNESVLVDDFVVPLSQLAMDLHAKTHQLKDLLFVKQLRHETRISLIHTNLRHEFHEFTLIDRNPSDVRGTSCNSCLQNRLQHY